MRARATIWIVAAWLSLCAISAHAADAALQAAAEAPAGGKIAVSWKGPGAARDFISIDEPGSADTKYGPYDYPAHGNPIAIQVPDRPGDYVIRYHVADGYGVIATTPLKVTAVSATLEPAPTVVVGGELSVTWSGPKQPGDFISIDAPGSPETTYGPYANTAAGSPAKIWAPDTAGDYVVRYHMAGGYRVIASASVKVTDVGATLSGPERVDAGADVPIKWTGPGRASDFISIDAVGSGDTKYGPYASVAAGNSSVKIRAPDQAGDYVVRYHMAGTYRVIGTIPLRVGAIDATLVAPDAIGAGAKLDVQWTGPGYPTDFISIDAPGAADRTYGNYGNVGKDKTVQVRAPDVAGDYQLRYHTGSSYTVLVSRPIKVEPATATLAAPNEVVAGKVFDVTWKGPDNEGDFVTLVPRGTAEGRYGSSNGYTRRGNPVRLEAPKDVGDYELRYLTGQSYAMLAAAPLRVTPGAAKGKLRVINDGAAAGSFGAVEFVLDASGSMLQRIGGERRIEIARSALIGLVDALPAGTGFALRVFGHKEANSCRTDLEISQPKIDKTAAAAKIKTINAMNLAKTPIAASLAKVKEDLSRTKPPLLVILMTDGEETCGGDPRAAIESLRAGGIDVRVNIVGFAIDEVGLKETFAQWAQVGNGAFFDAQNAQQLKQAVRATLSPTYEVLRDGQVVASGTVNGEAIELPVGAYAVRVHGTAPKDIGQAKIEPDTTAELRF
jgi:Mg-chelatase subunit ChlD